MLEDQDFREGRVWVGRHDSRDTLRIVGMREDSQGLDFVEFRISRRGGPEMQGCGTVGQLREHYEPQVEDFLYDLLGF